MQTADNKTTYKMEGPFSAIHHTGYKFILPEEIRAHGNTTHDPYKSPLRILENGAPLNWPHRDLISIFYGGGGVYGHWGDALYFSTSDNSDPNTNGRRYDIVVDEETATNQTLLKKPRKLHVVLTTTCNLWCRICREKPFKGPFMDLALFEKIADELLPTQELRLDSGGELLLHPQLPKILKKVTSLNQPFFSSSNGMLMTPEKARMLAESSLQHLQFSVDSPDKDTLEWIRRGSKFEGVIKGIKNLVKARKEVGRPFLITFHAAIMRRNASQLPDLVSLAHDLGVEGVTSCHLYVHSCMDPEESLFWNQDLHDEWREKAIDRARSLKSFYYGPQAFKDIQDKQDTGVRKCSYPDGGSYIHPDGLVSPCCVAADSFLGDLKESSFEKIWTNDEYDKLRKTYQTKNPFIAKCRDCLGSNGATCNWQSYFHPDHWNYVRDRLQRNAAS